MSTPELLAKAVLQALQRVAAVRAQTREELTAQRDALRRSEDLSADAGVLRTQRLNLADELKALRAKIEELEGRRDRLREELLRRLDAVWTRFAQEHGAQLMEARARRVAADFRDAVNEFSAELKAGGLDLERATPAQLRERLPSLRAATTTAEAAARAKAESVSEELKGAQELQRQATLLRQRKHDLKQEAQRVLARLRNHSRSAEQIKLVEDILAAEEGVLNRLRLEVLEPLLDDSRLEREGGLGGDDPLNELAELRRHS